VSNRYLHEPTKRRWGEKMKRGKTTFLERFWERESRGGEKCQRSGKKLKDISEQMVERSRGVTEKPTVKKKGGEIIYARNEPSDRGGRVF